MRVFIAVVAVVTAGALAFRFASHSAGGTGLPVTGVPSNIGLTLEPAQGSCAPDTLNLITVTANVTDGQGAAVADGTKVHFFVPSIGVPAPVDALTVGGQASSTVQVMSRVEQLVPIYVSSGDIERAIGFICDNPSQPNTPPAGPTPPSPPAS